MERAPGGKGAKKHAWASRGGLEETPLRAVPGKEIPECRVQLRFLRSPSVAENKVCGAARGLRSSSRKSSCPSFVTSGKRHESLHPRPRTLSRIPTTTDRRRACSHTYNWSPGPTGQRGKGRRFPYMQLLPDRTGALSLGNSNLWRARLIFEGTLSTRGTNCDRESQVKTRVTLWCWWLVENCPPAKQRRDNTERKRKSHDWSLLPSECLCWGNSPYTLCRSEQT